MGALAVIGELLIGFILGTAVLWGCSFTVKTAHATLKTAAIYNGIMTVLGAVLFGLALLFLQTESGIAGGILLASTGVTLVASFWLLMRMYDITFGATLWLVIAMWFVDTGVEKLIEFVF